MYRFLMLGKGQLALLLLSTHAELVFTLTAFQDRGSDARLDRKRSRALHQLGARVESLKEYLVSLDKRKQVSDARKASAFSQPILASCFVALDRERC